MAGLNKFLDCHGPVGPRNDIIKKWWGNGPTLPINLWFSMLNFRVKIGEVIERSKLKEDSGMDEKTNKIQRPANFVHHHRGSSSQEQLNNETILKELNILPGQTVIDAGCGNGYMAKEFSKLTGKTGKVYGLDEDEEAIETLKKETAKTNIEAKAADITKAIPVRDHSADLIYLSNVFHGFTEGQIESFQKEVKRILKPNGRLAIVEIQKEDTPYGPPMEIRFSPEELRQTIDLTAGDPAEAGEYYYIQIFENTK
jgi:ubiquinone/menaquinone biosynthesis C-methylase UbiE